MGQDHAKFTAEIAKGVYLKGQEVEMKLLIPLKAAQPYLAFLGNNQSKEVNVFIGDPQGSFDFGEDEEDAMYQKFTGRYVTTDSSGVVTKVEKPDGQDDENQQTLFGQDLEQEGDTPAGDDDASDPDQDSSGLDEDIPDWMTEGGDAGGEIDFTDDDVQESGDSVNELTDHEREIMGESSSSPSEDVEISKEVLEEYIVKNRPTFPDIDLDFPSLVEKRRSGTTWINISKEVGIPSTQISSKYKKYKEEVIKLMKDNGAA